MFVLLAATFILVAAYGPIAKLWDRWLGHRERMRAIDVDSVVTRTIEAYATEVKAKLDEMVLDVGTRTNSESHA